MMGLGGIQWLGLAAAVLSAVVLWRVFVVRSRRRRLAELRAWWGRIPPDQPSLEVCRRYDELRLNEPLPHRHRVDDRSWQDLDLDQLFLRMNRCLTAIGAQTLYRRLRTPHRDSFPVETQARLVETILQDRALREQVQMALMRCRHPHGWRVAELIWDEPPQPDHLTRLAPLGALAAVAVIGFAWTGFISWGWIVPVFLVNSAIHFMHRRRAEGYPLAPLGSLLDAADRCSSIEAEALRQDLNPLRRCLPATRQLRRRLAPLQIGAGADLMQYVAIMFLTDVLAFGAVISLLEGLQDELRMVFRIIGELDAACAVASFRTTLEAVCAPESPSSPGCCRVAGIRHPLVDNAIANDFVFDVRAVLITGSNMSGKTTFLKTMGCNAVLAQSFGFAVATTWEMPPLSVLTSIGRADNIIEGRSYYLAEVESVLRLVRAAESPSPHLFLVDEVFRGTNTVERIAGGAGVLGHLARPAHFVLAATHDLDLATILECKFANFHFADRVGPDGLDFDFTIRPGTCTSRNAIALLGYVGYPRNLVRRARLLAQELSDGGGSGIPSMADPGDTVQSGATSRKS